MHYKNAGEFISDCNLGLDIEFTYGGYGYVVFGWYENGPMIARQAPYDNMEQQFASADALLDGFMINGKPLRSIITQVDLQ